MKLFYYALIIAVAILFIISFSVAWVVFWAVMKFLGIILICGIVIGIVFYSQLGKNKDDNDS